MTKKTKKFEQLIITAENVPDHVHCIAR